MTVRILDAMAREGFEEVLALHDRSSGLRGFLGIHDTSRGPAFGGIRRFAYRDERAALSDCFRLSSAMSHKCALAGVPGGGGRLVLIDQPETDLRAAYRAVGGWIEHLEGRYYGGPDVGTGDVELDWVAQETSFVTPPGPTGPGDLAGATASGIFAGMGAALRHLDGAEDWPRRTIIVQGLGRVGWKVAARLSGLGARVLASDVDGERTTRARRDLGIQPLEPSSEFRTPCDVFSPCAMGGLLHDLTIARLEARIVCGAANNPLSRSIHGDRLHERGILYVPDIVVNAGSVIRAAEYHLEGRLVEVEEIEVRIGALATDVLHWASRERESPARIAWREAERRLREGRSRRNEPGVAPGTGPDEAPVVQSGAPKSR